MSLNATSLTKSAVVGLMPSAEFTPVVSPADCAKADVEIRSAAAAIVRVVIVMPPVLANVSGPRGRLRGCPNATRPEDMGSKAAGHRLAPGARSGRILPAGHRRWPAPSLVELVKMMHRPVAVADGETIGGGGRGGGSSLGAAPRGFHLRAL